MVFRRATALGSLVLSVVVAGLAAGCPPIDPSKSPGPAGSGVVVAPTTNPEIQARRQFLAAAPMTGPRMGFAYTTYRGRIYVFGGLTRASWDSATNSIDVYDPVSDSWALDGSLPFATSFAAAGVIGDKIYLVGGQTVNSAGCQPIDIDGISEYDPVRHTISPAGSLGTPRWGLSLLPFTFALKPGLLAVGGVQGPFQMQFSRLFEPRPSGSTGSGGCPGTFVQGQQMLDRATFITPEATSNAINLSPGRALAGSGTLNGTLFLTQGWVQAAGHPEVNNRTTSLDLPNKQWTGSVPPNLDGIWGPASAQASRDAFVVVGGLHPGYPADPGVSAGRREVRLISTSSNRTLEGTLNGLPNLPQGLGLGGAAVLDDKLYVFGGLGGSFGREVISASMWVLRDLSPAAASQPQEQQQTFR